MLADEFAQDIVNIGALLEMTPDVAEELVRHFNGSLKKERKRDKEMEKKINGEAEDMEGGGSRRVVPSQRHHSLETVEMKAIPGHDGGQEAERHLALASGKPVGGSELSIHDAHWCG